MKISVIIPVFNAAAFVEKAVQSVLFHKEVKEVIIVNDGSTDNSLQIIEQLQKADPRIKIYQHHDGINKGRSASRNLALQNVTQPFIAFLDADDFYLENRFESDKLVFESDASVDGIYNAIGVHFYRDFEDKEHDALALTTLSEVIAPEELFEYLLNGSKGYFSIDGLTIKRAVISDIGCFEEHLVVAEDTDWLLKMALVKKIIPGNINEAIAIRGVHNANIFDQNEQYKIYRPKMFESVIAWSYKNNIKKDKIDLLMSCLFNFRYKQKYTFTTELKYWLYLINKEPKLLQSNFALKYCPIVRKRKQLFPFLFK